MKKFFSVNLPALGTGATDWTAIRPVQVIQGLHTWLALQYDCGQDMIDQRSPYFREAQLPEEWVNRDQVTEKEVVFTHDLGHRCRVEAVKEEKFNKFDEKGVAVYAVISYGDTGAHRANIRANGVDVLRITLPDLPRVADVIPGKIFY